MENLFAEIEQRPSERFMRDRILLRCAGTGHQFFTHSNIMCESSLELQRFYYSGPLRFALSLISREFIIN